DMRYEAPETLDKAVALLAAANGDARVLAGGTDLLVQLRADMIEPELIVDIKKIAETRAITREGGGWRIGPAVPGAGPARASRPSSSDNGRAWSRPRT